MRAVTGGTGQIALVGGMRIWFDFCCCFSKDRTQAMADCANLGGNSLGGRCFHMTGIAGKPGLGMGSRQAIIVRYTC